MGKQNSQQDSIQDKEFFIQVIFFKVKN